MTAQSYAPLGDSHLPPIDSANSQVFWNLKGTHPNPQFYQLKKKINLFCLFKKESQLYIFKLEEFGITSDYILTSNEASAS